jgi:hypothetical protein
MLQQQQAFPSYQHPPTPLQPNYGRPSFGSKHIDSKAWPKFDGVGPLAAFLEKLEFFMDVAAMAEDDKRS